MPAERHPQIDDHGPMTEPAGRVAWIAIAPVKSMALVFLDHAHLGRDGIPGDRAFALVDEHDRLVNGKRAGSLATIRVDHDLSSGALVMKLPDGSTIDGTPVRGEPIEALFSRKPRTGHLVAGPWSAALSSWSGHALRLVALDAGEGADRGPSASLVSSAALAVLAAQGGADQPLDRRRFRMTFGVEGIEAYAEDRWIDLDVRIGGAVMRIAGNVGRCAVTTQDPDTGLPTFDTLHVLQHSRGHLATTEPLPFGVWAEVTTPGPVAIGDPLSVIGERKPR